MSIVKELKDASITENHLKLKEKKKEALKIIRKKMLKLQKEL